MDILRSRTGRVMIVGHRGAAAYAPENTMASFEKAHELGVDMVELDVHLSADGRCVVIHDETVEGTTDGHGLVGALTYDELRELNAGNGQSVPELGEVLTWAQDVDLPLSIELKQPNLCMLSPYVGLVEAVLDLVDRHGMLDRVLVHSYHHPSILQVKQLRPEVLTAISWDGADFLDVTLPAREVRADGVHHEWRSTSSEAVAQAHAAGLHIQGGGIPDGRDDIVRALIRNGVDMIDGDAPDHLRSIVEDELHALD
jgi:glycerophosphoryl diester phosphodiesterase